MPAPGPTSLDEARDWMRKRFAPAAAAGVRASVRFELSGAGGGTIAVRVDDGRLEVDVAPGDTSGAPDATLALSARDFFAVLAGRENADLLLMAGHLRIEGDLALALKLRALFGAAA